MFFTERNLARLKESIGRGRISFQISLDGPTAELHNAIRGKGAFERTAEAIPRVDRRGFRRRDQHRGQRPHGRSHDRYDAAGRPAGRAGASYPADAGVGSRHRPQAGADDPARARRPSVARLRRRRRGNRRDDRQRRIIARAGPRQARPQDRSVQLRLGHARRVQRRPGLPLRLARGRARPGMRQHPQRPARRHLARLEGARAGAQRFGPEPRGVQRLPPEIPVRRRLAVFVALRQPRDPRQERPPLGRAVLRNLHGLDPRHAVGTRAGRRAVERRRWRLRGSASVQRDGRSRCALRAAEHDSRRPSLRSRLLSLRLRAGKRRRRGRGSQACSRYPLAFGRRSAILLRRVSMRSVIPASNCCCRWRRWFARWSPVRF